MSADNGIYIGIFPKKDGTKEYRVIEAMAIENCDYGFDQEPDYGWEVPIEYNEQTKTMQDLERFKYYGTAKSFSNMTEAGEEASRLFQEVTKEWGICEYGICEMNYDRPLRSFSEEENRALTEAYEQRLEDKRRLAEEERERNTKYYFVLMPVRVVEYKGDKKFYPNGADIEEVNARYDNTYTTGREALEALFELYSFQKG